LPAADALQNAYTERETVMLQMFNHVKAAQQEAMSASAQAFSTWMESATKYSELSVAAAQDSMSGLAQAAKSFEGWSPEAAFANPMEKMVPVAGKAAHYAKSSLSLAQETADALSDTSYAAAKTMAKRAEALTDEMAGMLPAQTEPLVKNLKAAMEQNLAWYDQAYGVTNQLQKQFFATAEQFVSSVTKETTVSSVVSIVPKRKRA
jgi:hypothetical protein